MTQVSLVQVGIGTVGGEAIAQVLAQRERWRRTLGLDVRIGALVVRNGALAAESAAGLPDDVLRSAVTGRRAGKSLDELTGADLIPAPEAVLRLAAEGPTIVMDAGAGEQTAILDARALAARTDVVLSNKAPLALPLSNPLAAALWDNAGPRGHLRYETTCGAGLPVISTLRTLLETGDEIIEIVGALSGTLGAIFSDVAAGQSFSAAVRSAKARGYTEPDPRDDLSGLDVARKALILARTIGRRANLDEIAVESLVPANLRDVSVETFLDRVVAGDASFAERAAAARTNGATLKYVATVTPDGPLAVGVQAVPTSGVLGSLQGPENIVSIRTRRYDAYPLTIVGPGAGAAVTAAGMLGDALALALRRR
ncbi:MAG TPA: hypothetical protein VFQ80_19600 [Thermomicrobiales bacterium]|nr:hypothetical protein [Thermomicrobiales bacterium]